MFRVQECCNRIRGCLSSITTLHVRSFAKDPTSSNEGGDERSSSDIRQGLYTDAPIHPRADEMHPRDEPKGLNSSIGDGTEDDSQDQTLDDKETEEILEGLYTGEPLSLRVDQIKRDAEEIKMMANLLGQDKQNEKSYVDEKLIYKELSEVAKKSRLQRSERYFPKLKKPPRASTLNELKVETVIRSYCSRGHLAALIDPLYILREPMFRPEFPSRTVLKEHRVPVDKETLYHLLPDDATTLGGGHNRIKLDKLMKKLNAAYCDTIGVEYSYVHDVAAKSWIKDRMETTELRHIHREQKRYCLEKLIQIEAFAEFLKERVPVNRYIPLGSETSILGVDHLIRRAMKKHNARSFVIGMRRLGRMHMLSDVLNVNYETIFSLLLSEIGKSNEGLNLGIHSRVPSSQLKDVIKEITLVSSCSIPENFFPLTLGYVKGCQKRIDDNGEEVWPIIIHMAKGLNSQGIVYETLKLSCLTDYETFGTIHIVFNNQMEQTLRRETHMTSEYCTDSLRTLNIPIFHVNGDDLAAVHYVLRLAADFRSKFKRDVAVDIVSYSRFMTQRVAIKHELIKVQQAIAQTEPIVSKYSKLFIKEGIITQLDIENWRKEVIKKLTDAWQKAMKVRTLEHDRDTWTSQVFLDKVYKLEHKYAADENTGISLKTLKKISKCLCAAPEHMTLNPKHIGFLKRRKYLVDNNNLDWVLCEALAYASLLLEGIFVRISGMDVNRRLHVVQEDAVHGETYNLLNNISLRQAKYYLCKSSTSQYATAAFEYGYSLATLKTLVIWEAPEGDKTSKAQVVIDHYIGGGYVKYNYHSNMVMLIPHYHKCETASRVCNGRPERFLQLSSDSETEVIMDMKTQLKLSNMILVNVSTPANLFHVLRRQMYLPYRRPLVIFTTNLLCCHQDTRSQFNDLIEGTRFQPYIPDDTIHDISKVQKIILCTGRIVHDLKKERKARKLGEEIAICTIEQVCPLPYKLINEDLIRYISAKFAWVQEEPINQGWWSYVETRLEMLPAIMGLECVARPARADGGSRSVSSCYDEHYSVIDRAMTINRKI